MGLKATNFESTTDPDRCFSAQCKTVILFLSDGQPDSWGSSDYQQLKSKAAGSGIKLFTYALGSGADTSKLAQLATDHNGEMKQVTSSSALVLKMISLLFLVLLLLWHNDNLHLLVLVYQMAQIK